MTAIQLTRNQKALIDDVDVDLRLLNWYANPSGRNTYYASRMVRKPDGRQTVERLHNVVALRMGIVGRVRVKDGNGLNCTRANLESARRSQ